MDASEKFDYNIDDYFERKFCFSKKQDWILPSNLQEENDLWSVKSLIALKENLNDTKSLLNDKGQDWHEHTSDINKASYVINSVKEKVHPEILTQAWLKFYEILSKFSPIPEKDVTRVLFLCEAPGGFISALNYYLSINYSHINWEWMANTLNPYYEGHSIRNAVVDDRLILPTLRHWYFGTDNTGDITEPRFITDICNYVQGTGLFDLITADGSIDCLDNPAEQETVVGKLHFCELIVALSCLATHGCFVIKKFTFFECTTICQLYLLNCVFEKVHVFKPFTSRPSNSEVYVICLGFLGSDAVMHILQQYKDIYCFNNKVAVFPRSAIPDSFMQQIEECTKYFSELQIKAIEENLMLYPLENNLIIDKLDGLKVACAEAYIQKYQIRSCPDYESSKLYHKKVTPSFYNESYTDMKSLYFYAVGDTFDNIMKSSSMQWHDIIVDVEKRINTCFPASRKRPYEEIGWHYPWKEVRKRMKSKSFVNWIAYGKKVTCVQNSKFCYPVLLHLWNRISLNTQVDVQSHMKSESNWYSEDSLVMCLKENSNSLKNVLIVSSSPECTENDSLLLYLKQKFGFNVVCSLNKGSDCNISVFDGNKLIYMNSATWEKSLHMECSIKGILTELLFSAIKVLTKGDTLFLCIQSILTRYMAGIIFMLISLFEKFTTILPEYSAPAGAGQIWVFKNYQNCAWTNKVYLHFKSINELRASEEKDILQIVPMGSLCDASFLSYLRNLNNKHLLQRLKNLIKTEKRKIRKSV